MTNGLVFNKLFFFKEAAAEGRHFLSLYLTDSSTFHISPMGHVVPNKSVMFRGLAKQVLNISALHNVLINLAE